MSDKPSDDIQADTASAARTCSAAPLTETKQRALSDLTEATQLSLRRVQNITKARRRNVKENHSTELRKKPRAMNNTQVSR